MSVWRFYIQKTQISAYSLSKSVFFWCETSNRLLAKMHGISVEIIIISAAKRENRFLGSSSLNGCSKGSFSGGEEEEI